MINKKVIEYIEAIIVAVVIALVVRTFVMQPFTIPSGSMLNTLLIGDCVLVNKFVYGVKVPFTDDYLVDVGEPERGDVVVFEFPLDPSHDYNKRIVGVPGDVITVREKSTDLHPLVVARETHGEREVPGWLEARTDPMMILVHALPKREQIAVDVQEQLIVELYSKVS